MTNMTTETPQLAPLWTNERAIDYAMTLSHKVGEIALVGRVAPQIIDEYEADRATTAARVQQLEARIAELEGQVAEMKMSLHSLGTALSGTEAAWEDVEGYMFGEDDDNE